jgi:hypothetical protein
MREEYQRVHARNVSVLWTEVAYGQGLESILC